ncbi:hypothetical protein K493DRAFT_251462 [Basidiobolus meristosporus CBS 931.73]|uniref:PAS domain-containing protein n=1 Tax=Basidiobolus meristosporus CBS 931.73 TaxID=1314790 RepID=A0A1Y1Z9M6_9FUNG|nr:hypothetical protein K493DRAFT_251462 [Basidiobolus meristosporus CBS 931.73]|eukprot:ORY06962.1 hypothetical protein K493DRAFT_251462 [Basidiobolus meristosporus CBS 931.73]
MNFDNYNHPGSQEEVKFENFIEHGTALFDTSTGNPASGYIDSDLLCQTSFFQRPINGDGIAFDSQSLNNLKSSFNQTDLNINISSNPNSMDLSNPNEFFNPVNMNTSGLVDLDTMPTIGTVDNLEKEKTLGSFPGLYSNSGFDMMGILSRISHRPNPQVNLGPVDMSCAFLVVDACRFDFPIVYASASFEKLSGYKGTEIVGKNCRFLQSPDGQVSLGSRRRYTDNNAVHNIRNHVLQGKEYQVSIVNYRRDGQPFINLVTIVPIAYEGAEITHYVGFQVNLIEQPNDILQKMKDGTYIVNYNLLNIPPLISTGLFHRPFDEYYQTATLTASNGSSISISPEVFDLIGIGSNSDEDIAARLWNQMLLDNSEDLIHVVSLKGIFLFCSPSCKKILGYDPEELIGQSVAQVCSPSDLVPVMRDIKESASSQDITSLCYRIKRKDNSYIWFEAHGRLHSDQGKGRKCVVLVGRQRPTYKLSREALEVCGGLSEDEFWGKLTLDGTYLYATSECQRLLGMQPDELVGTSLYQLVKSDRTTSITSALQQAREGTTVKLRHNIQNRNGQYQEVHSVFYPGDFFYNTQRPAFILCQTKVLEVGDEETSSTSTSPTPQTNQLSSGNDNVFDMLHVDQKTTWQYELHQLRLANKKLREEIEKITNSRKKKKRKTASSPSSSTTCNSSL